jgi:hypothetical protein
MYFLDGDVLMIWYGFQGLLSNLESYLCRVNANRIPSMFMDSLFGIQQKIREKAWDAIKRVLPTFLPEGCLNIFECGKIFIPINANLHWTFFTIFMKEKMIAYYDSFNSKSSPISFPVQLLYDWLEHESEELGKSFSQHDWSFVPVTVQRQMNGVDCGYHLLKNTLLIQMDLPLMEYKVSNRCTCI